MDTVQRERYVLIARFSVCEDMCVFCTLVCICTSVCKNVYAYLAVLSLHICVRLFVHFSTFVDVDTFVRICIRPLKDSRLEALKFYIMFFCVQSLVFTVTRTTVSILQSTYACPTVLYTPSTV